MTYPPAYVKKWAAWNDRFITDPLTVLCTELVAGWRWLTPTAITLVAFLLATISWYYYLDGSRTSQLIGALFWEANYLLDGVDGKLARKRGESSPFGAMLDGSLDKVKKVVALAALCVAELEHPWLLAGLYVMHYILLRLPVTRHPPLVEASRRRGARGTLDPLDLLFLLAFIGPLLGRVVEVTIVVVALQCLDLGVHTVARQAHQGTSRQ